MVTNYSPMTWVHINMLWEYDFSEDNFRDSIGIFPCNLPPELERISRGVYLAIALIYQVIPKILWRFKYLYAD